MSAKSQTVGGIFLIGGNASSCFKPFVKLAGGKCAHVVVLPHASSAPRREFQRIARVLAQAGAGRVSVLWPKSKRALPDDATAIFFLGGSQGRLIARVSPALRCQLQAFRDKGILMGGTSAGAVGMSSVMIVDGMNDGIMRSGRLELSSGLALVPNAAIDTHFAGNPKHRLCRLLTVISLHPEVLGIGLEEDTGVHIDARRQARVYGIGHAWFVQVGSEYSSNFQDKASKRRATVDGARVSLLPAGKTFDLTCRRLVKEKG